LSGSRTTRSMLKKHLGRSKLAEIVARDLYEAYEKNVFDNLFGIYMFSLISICKNERDYRKEMIRCAKIFEHSRRC